MKTEPLATQLSSQNIPASMQPPALPPAAMLQPLPSTATKATTQTICSDCGAICIPTGCGTGYATYARDTKHETRVCYSCADKRQREELKDRSKPFCAYVSSDGHEITSWTGGKLMKVVESFPCVLTRQSFTHDRKSFMSLRAVDCHGGHWFGRGSSGIAIKLRPVKYKGLSMPEIRYRMTEAGSHFFDRKTLKFFGETMKNFTAGERLPDGKQWVYRHGGRAGSKTYLFNATTNKLEDYHPAAG